MYQASYEKCICGELDELSWIKTQVQKVWIKLSVDARIVKGKPQKYFLAESIDFLTFEYLH